MPSAYPQEPVKVLHFTYFDDLLLTRKIAAVKNRKSEDANYVVTKDYCSEVTIQDQNGNQSQFPIEVPRCLITDLASVPKLARWFVGRVGPHLEASIVHDWLYVAWQDNVPQVQNLTPTDAMRCFADEVYLVGMRAAKVSRWKSWLIHKAVRISGKSSFYAKNHSVFACKPQGDTKPQHEIRRERYEKALALREKGLTLKEVGERLGVGRTRAGQLIARARRYRKQENREAEET